MSKLAKLAMAMQLQASVENHSEPTAPLASTDTQALEVVEALNELAQEVQINTEITDDLIAIDQAEIALEGWCDMVQRSLAKGGLRPETAEAISFGVRTIETAMGIEKPIIPSLESFGGNMSQTKATEIALEGFKETISKVIEGQRRAFKAMVDGTKDGWAAYRKTGDKLSTRADGLIKRLQALNSASSDADISVSDAKLFADGKFVGNSAANLQPLLTFVVEKWPQAQDEYAGELFSAMASKTTAPDAQAVINKLLNTSKLFTAFPGSTESAGVAGQDLKRSVILGGNKAVFVGFTEASPPATSEPKEIKAYLTSVVLQLRPVPGAAVPPRDFTVTVPSVKALQATVTGIQSAANVLAMAKAPSVRAKVEEVSAKWFDDNKENDDATVSEYVRIYDLIAPVIQAIARLDVVGVTYHVGTVLNAMLSLAQTQVEALEKAKD